MTKQTNIMPSFLESRTDDREQCRPHSVDKENHKVYGNGECQQKTTCIRPGPYFPTHGARKGFKSPPKIYGFL